MGTAVLSVYREDQWEALRATAVDGSELRVTWKEWNAEGEKFMAELKARGIPYVCVLLDVEEIQQYCKERGIPNDRDARMRFAQHKHQAEQERSAPSAA